MIICYYVLIHSLIHSLQIKQWKILGIDARGLSDVRKKVKKPAAQSSFKQFKIFHENLVAVERAKVELTQTNRSMWDLPSRIFQKRWCIISTTITANQSIQTWHCYAKTSMPASIYSIFLSTRKKSLLNKVPCVPRVPKCPSARVSFDCPSAQMPER